MGYQLLGQRYYDPYVGRFLNPDPIGFLGGLNRYAYCGHDPVNFLDPEGLRWKEVGGIVGGIVGGALGAVEGGIGAVPGVAIGSGFGAYIGSRLDGNDVPHAAGEAIGEAVTTYATGKVGGLAISGYRAYRVEQGRKAAAAAAEGMQLARVSKACGLMQNQTIVQTSNGRGAVGERILRAILGGGSRVSRGTPAGRRVIDVLIDGASHESMVGYTTLDKRAREEISKDLWLLAQREVKSVTWHFFRSPKTGKVGASKELLFALKQAGIKAVIH
jgi:hypothetical protein